MSPEDPWETADWRGREGGGIGGSVGMELRGKRGKGGVRGIQGAAETTLSLRIPAVSRSPLTAAAPNSRLGLRRPRLGRKSSPLRLHRFSSDPLSSRSQRLAGGFAAWPRAPSELFGRQNGLRPFTHLRYQWRNWAKPLSGSLEGSQERIRALQSPIDGSQALRSGGEDVASISWALPWSWELANNFGCAGFSLLLKCLRAVLKVWKWNIFPPGFCYRVWSLQNCWKCHIGWGNSNFRGFFF